MTQVRRSGTLRSRAKAVSMERQLVPRFSPPSSDTDLALQRATTKRIRAFAWWLLATIGMGAFLYWTIRIAPTYLARPAPSSADINAMEPENRAATLINYANAKNQVRTTLIQGIAGVTFLTTAFFAWRTVAVNRLGQLTDRFTKKIGRA